MGVAAGSGEYSSFTKGARTTVVNVIQKMRQDLVDRWNDEENVLTYEKVDGRYVGIPAPGWYAALLDPNYSQLMGLIRSEQNVKQGSMGRDVS